MYTEWKYQMYSSVSVDCSVDENRQQIVSISYKEIPFFHCTASDIGPCFF